MKLSKYEARYILNWAGWTLEDSQHWGNGKSFLPLEEEILKKIENALDYVQFNLPEVNIIFYWASNYLKGGSALLGEDIVILKKILKFYKSLNINDEQIKEKIKYIESVLK
jgi:hypothetical protein